MKRILDAADPRTLDVRMNAVNGGGFAVTAVRKNDPRHGSDAVINWRRGREDRMRPGTPRRSPK